MDSFLNKLYASVLLLILAFIAGMVVATPAHVEEASTWYTYECEIPLIRWYSGRVGVYIVGWCKVVLGYHSNTHLKR